MRANPTALNATNIFDTLPTTKKLFTWFPPLAVFLISATSDFSFLSTFRISLSMSRSPERTARFASLAAAGCEQHGSIYVIWDTTRGETRTDTREGGRNRNTRQVSRGLCCAFIAISAITHGRCPLISHVRVNHGEITRKPEDVVSCPGVRGSALQIKLHTIHVLSTLRLREE